MLLLQLRTAVLLSLKIAFSEQTQFSYRTGVICGVVKPKDNVKIDKTPLQSWYLKKTKKTATQKSKLGLYVRSSLLKGKTKFG